MKATRYQGQTLDEDLQRARAADDLWRKNLARQCQGLPPLPVPAELQAEYDGHDGDEEDAEDIDGDEETVEEIGEHEDEDQYAEGTHE